jgi:hypothetical protein
MSTGTPAPTETFTPTATPTPEPLTSYELLRVRDEFESFLLPLRYIYDWGSSRKTHRVTRYGVCEEMIERNPRA